LLDVVGQDLVSLVARHISKNNSTVDA